MAFSIPHPQYIRGKITYIPTLIIYSKCKLDIQIKTKQLSKKRCISKEMGKIIKLPSNLMYK